MTNEQWNQLLEAVSEIQERFPDGVVFIGGIAVYAADAMKRVKPKEILAGRAYRMAEPFLSGPSDQIAVVVDIRQVDRRRREVEVEWLLPGPPFRTFSYAEFPRRVWREEPASLN